jgi:hypothetical protein
MDYFYGGGGNNRPDFTYRFLVKRVSPEMFKWCEEYPLTGPFERWHVIYNYKTSFRNSAAAKDQPETPLIQFESRKAAYMFRLTFSEYITEDLTYSFAKDDKWTT